MQVLGLRMPLIKPGDDLPAAILKAAKQVGGIKNGDVLVVASSVVATVQGRFKRLSDIKPSIQAKRLAKRCGLRPEFVELVLREADRVLGSVRGCLLTLKDGLLCPNAGVDCTNAPPGHAVLAPKRPQKIAREILKALKRGGKRLGVIIADSRVQPLHIGTVGQALGVAGFEPVVDCRGQRDLFGKRLRMTYRAVADQLASAAQLVMGETAERIPAVVIRGADVVFTNRPKFSLKIVPKRCIYAKSLKIT
jgi:coenzyme F420-0:L-glutamate ligase